MELTANQQRNKPNNRHRPALSIQHQASSNPQPVTRNSQPATRNIRYALCPAPYTSNLPAPEYPDP